MKKNNSKSHHVSNENQLPDIFHMDMLAYASDEELSRYYSQVSSAKDRASNSTFDLQPWEVEISYLQREIKIRSDRRKAHENYLKNNPEEVFENESLDMQN